MSRRDARDGGEPLVVLVQASTGMRGPQRTVVEFAAWLAGHRDVVLAAPDGWVLNQARRIAPDVRPLILPGDRKSGRMSGARVIEAFLNRQTRPVLLHANGLSALTLAGPAALRHGAPVFVHFHAFELPARSRVAATSWLRLGVHARLHAVSDFSRGLLEATGLRAHVGSVLPNPFDVAALAVAREPAPGPRPGPFRVGFVGGADPRKGLHRAIRIAAACRDLDLEWHVVGVTADRHSEYVDRCRALAQELGVAGQIRWMGKVGDPREAYEAVDALIVASELESFCRVAVEAMAAGLPIVATRIPGLSEVVWDETSGLLFDPQDVEEGAAQLRRIVTDGALRERLSQGAVQGAARFDVNVVGPRLERLYADLMAPVSGPRVHGEVAGLTSRPGQTVRS